MGTERFIIRGSHMVEARVVVPFPLPPGFDEPIDGTLIQGDAVNIRVEVVNRFSGTAENLTGYKLGFVMRALPRDPNGGAPFWTEGNQGIDGAFLPAAPVLLRNVAAGGSLTEIDDALAVKGVFYVKITSAGPVSTLNVGPYQFALAAAKGADRYTLAQGKLSLLPSVMTGVAL